MMEEDFKLTHIETNIHVINFINKVLVQLYNEEDASAIREELHDHIYSLALDYCHTGYSQDASIHKALLQMGDPGEIGYSFTDYNALKKRRLILTTLKILAISLFTLTLLITLLLIEDPNSQVTNNQGLSDYQEFKLELEDQSFIEQIFSYFSWYTNKYSEGIFYLLYIPIIFITSSSRNRLQGIPIKKLAISKEPLLILWPYKKAFSWEYLVIALLFSPILIVFIIIMVSDGVHVMKPLSFFITLGVSIWLYFYSEKFRIPKYLILDAGIMIKTRLISWVAIDSITWVQDYTSKGSNYKLILKSQTNDTNSNLTTTKTIFVNGNQYTQVSSILNQHLC